MKRHRIYFLVCDAERLRRGYQRIVCLFLAGLLVACSSNPPREASHQSQATTLGAQANSAPQVTERKQVTEKKMASLSPASMEASADEPGDYQVGAFDLLQIEVFQVPELSQTVRVNSKGYISLPLIGAVQVSGLTSQQLEVYLAKLLGEKYLQDPQVSVFIEEYTSQQVTVEGAVNTPGIYPLKGPTTLLQVLAQAKGVTNLADRSDVKLFRTTEDNTKKVASYDLEAIRDGEMPDPKVQSEDVVVVEESGTRVFFDGIHRYFRLFINPVSLFY